MSLIAPKKVAMVHVAKRELRLTDDDYRNLLLAVAGVSSAADLTEVDFVRAMAEFTRLGFRPKQGYGRRIGFASPAQVKLIRKLWADWHGPDAGERALNAWLNRYHGVSALRFATSQKAAAVLTALKLMTARKHNAA